ncbi:hypothetical protein ODJ79_27165 [Actinoplanes sp. KI2]|uniref:hypothetical protein n=1 Tax=Actinoplanes sp. KI2 TaxID=2983315 RepID=UPI0021D5AB3B|nr:hypothetical protein [Actinoplanes sp. KI2]MCU7727429.1 hypothetical protein [Actinoplanes sp. KI2]
MSAATAAGATAAGAAAGPSTTARTTDKACSGGLSGQESGVVRITCGGPATIRITVGDVSRVLHGGECHAAGGVWSAAVGVIIDATGVHGKYAGPPVSNVVVNDTATPGRGTIQSMLDGKLYFVLGDAVMKVSADRKSAHLEGRSDRASDAPGAKLTVSVTC